MIEKIDNTPDKTLVLKLGEQNYSIDEATGDLFDNAVSARNDDGVTISLIIDAKKFVIEDNGVGMNREEAKKCLTIAYSGWRPRNIGGGLGEFGLGLKAASMTLGSKVTVITKAVNGPKFTIVLDLDEFLLTKDWNLLMNSEDAPAAEHGTTIIVENLKEGILNRVKEKTAVPFFHKLRESLAKRYRPYIIKNNVKLLVGPSKNLLLPCVPQEPKLIPGTYVEFKHILPSGSTIFGWYGLSENPTFHGSGFDLFRRGRLIQDSVKIGYRAHPSLNSLIGEIHLDHVPATTNKRELIILSTEYYEFINNFWGDQNSDVPGLIDKITKMARTHADKEQKQQRDKQREKLLNEVSKALSDEPEFEEIGHSPAPAGNVLGNMLIVGRKAKVEKKKPLPKHVPGVKRPGAKKTSHVSGISVGGKRFTFDVQTKDLRNREISSAAYENSSGFDIEVFVNTGFGGYKTTKDMRGYLMREVAEAIASVVHKGGEKAAQLRNRIISKVTDNELVII